MERKEALKFIQAKISEGMPVHLIYKELKNKVRYQSDQLSYLSQIPDLKTQKENKFNNFILSVLLAFILLMQLAISFLIVIGTVKNIDQNIPFYVLGGWLYILVPIMLIFIIKDILQFKRVAYRYLIMLAIFSAIYLNEMIAGFFLWLIFFFPWIIAAVLSFYIMKKAFPYDRLFKGFDEKKFQAELDFLLENSKEN
jgi:hypothetical protein